MESATRVRDQIYDFLKREMIGPDPGPPAVQLNGEEILRPQDSPTLRYAAGVLFPSKTMIADHESPASVQTDSDIYDEQGLEEIIPEPGQQSTDVTPSYEQQPETEQEINRANEFMPSGMGLSTLIRLPERLLVKVSAGRYYKRELEGAGRKGRDGKYKPYMGWWRQPVDADLVFECDELLGAAALSAEKQVEINGENTGLFVHILSRSYAASSTDSRARIVTVTLINRNTYTRGKDDGAFFQCKFSVQDPDSSHCFLEYPERPRNDMEEDPEEASMRLLYRRHKVYAIGHGCAADWIDSPDDATSKVWTESLPSFEMKPVLPFEIEGLELSMLALSDGNSKTPIELCERLAEEYLNWINKEAQRIADQNDVPPDLANAAHDHIRKCRMCHDRIRYGVELLKTNPELQKAFSLMNQAMLMQWNHYRLASEPHYQRKWERKDNDIVLERRYEAPDYESCDRNWWPFQLAFILMNLRSMWKSTPEDIAEREILDLIWFPTGGGKTEAYLGLTAFTIFLRRLREPTNAGTTVLMRYTLRLLTTQQYQRAASLICACEYIRRRNEEELGDRPITIGLWVGKDASPNTEEEAAKALNSMLIRNAQNPFVVLNCPWCGAQMGPVERVSKKDRRECRGYHQLGNPKRVQFQCDDPDCEFNDKRGLPLKVVDEAIYRDPATLIIGTVDKFAMLPWRPEARALFGLTEDGQAPPELIIQDELHLISGPLGSMVGHYETIINELCVDRRGKTPVPPRIIASTATISRAEEQVRGLYGKEPSKMFLFPPQGLDAGNSFFAYEAKDKPGRLYVGVFASALTSHITAQARVMSVLLQAAKLQDSVEPESIDPYWTLMSYFNSLRELGHAATLVQARIPEYMDVIVERMGLRWLGGEEAAAKHRFIRRHSELTSRIQSANVPEILQSLFTKYDGTDPSRAVDVCLATNMIQVGLDVPRLSLMSIMRQPKTTSEYIQASSRVGRRWPGLVVTVFNTANPRDRSHFEHFRAYHESIYSYVEPTSVTPFALPVRERALHALLVAMARLKGDESIRSRPKPAPDDTLLDEIREVIRLRVSLSEPDEAEETMTMLDDIISEWQRVPADKYGDFVEPDPKEMPMMYPSGTQKMPQWGEKPLPTLTSMRDVDAECDIDVLSKYPTR